MSQTMVPSFDGKGSSCRQREEDDFKETISGSFRCASARSVKSIGDEV